MGSPLLSKFSPPEGAKTSVGVRARLKGMEGMRGSAASKTHFEMFFSVIDSSLRFLFPLIQMYFSFSNSSLRHLDEIVQASAVLAFGIFSFPFFFFTSKGI